MSTVHARLHMKRGNADVDKAKTITQRHSERRRSTSAMTSTERR